DIFFFVTEGYDFTQGDFVDGNGFTFTAFFLHHDGPGPYQKGAGDNTIFRQIVNGNLQTLPSSGVASLTATAGGQVRPKIAVSPPSLDCGSVFLNGSKTKRFIVANIGDPGSLLTGSITSPPLLPFSVAGPVAFSLGSGDSEEFNVTFNPVSSGMYTDSIGI